MWMATFAHTRWHPPLADGACGTGAEQQRNLKGDMQLFGGIQQEMAMLTSPLYSIVNPCGR